MERDDLTGRIGKHEAMVLEMTEAYDRRQDEDGEAVAACNEAIKLLQGYPGMGEDAAVSLLQVQLKESTLKISTRAMKEGSAFIPLINALATMIEMETVNPSACVEVIKLIEELRDAIQKTKDSDTVNFHINSAMWDQTMTDMEK